MCWSFAWIRFTTVIGRVLDLAEQHHAVLIGHQPVGGAQAVHVVVAEGYE